MSDLPKLCDLTTPMSTCVFSEDACARFICGTLNETIVPTSNGLSCKAPEFDCLVQIWNPQIGEQQPCSLGTVNCISPTAHSDGSSSKPISWKASVLAILIGLLVLVLNIVSN
ncbi:uncharacterized protein IL334_000562 [Kwoniella shivajii]|uniref:Extracellular membrane protein CFEM domain-containing protein n=1 Tax=Kwoniella shivajii TaxID=564305 RepID=A0ABZ1CPG9_9TREE|nr:hypothetical protein IL334_000562 [Kwoniella shivajii]